MRIRARGPVACAIVALPVLALPGLFVASACRRVADERPVASLASSPETEARFDAIRTRWTDASSKARAGMRPELEALLIDVERRGDGLEPIVRAYLAMAWLDAGVPAAAEAVARPLVEGRPGVPNDLATLVKGASARRLGRARESIDLLRPLVGKLIDPFARPMLYEEITEAHIDDERWEDALVYAEGWLRSATPAERLAVRAAVQRVLRRIPEPVVLRLLEAEANAPPEARHSADLILALAARLEEAQGQVAGSTDGAPAGDAGAASPTPEAPVITGDAGAPVLSALVSLPRFDPRTIALLVPTSAPGWAPIASAIVRAATGVTAPTLATALHGDAGPDASSALNVPPVGHRLLVFDTGGTAAGAVAALDAAERDGAAVVVGGAIDAEASALVAAARPKRIPVVLLRRAGGVIDPKGEKPTWISVGPSLDDEEQATVAIAKAVASDVAIVEPWPDPGTTPEPPTDPMRWRCDASPKVAGGTAFPIAAWKAKKVSAIVVLGDARCARRIAVELATSPGAFRPAFVLGPGALDLAHEPIPFARTVLGAGALPADDLAPQDLRTLWIDQGAPVSWWNGLGHDAAALAASALPGDLLPVTETAKLQQARTTTANRLLAAKAALWTTTAKGPAANGVVPRTTSMRAFAPGAAAHPAWAP